MTDQSTIEAKDRKFFIPEVNPDFEFIVAKVGSSKEGFTQINFRQNFHTTALLTAMFRDINIKDVGKQIPETKASLGGKPLRGEIPDLNPKGNRVEVHCAVINSSITWSEDQILGIKSP